MKFSVSGFVVQGFIGFGDVLITSISWSFNSSKGSAAVLGATHAEQFHEVAVSAE